MAEVVEQVKIVKKEDIPEEMAGFERLGLNERHELVGIDDEGNSKRVPRVGAMLLKLALETGVAEEVPLVTSSPEIAEIQRLHNHEIETLKQQHEREIQELKNQHTQEMEKLSHEFDTKLNDQDKRISELTTSMETLTAKLEKKGIDVASHFEPGDSIAVPIGNGKYKTGYKVEEVDEAKSELSIRNNQTGLPSKISSTAVKKEDELTPEERIDGPVTRDKVEVRESVAAKFRRRIANEPAPPQYYIDEDGRYYYLEGDEPIYVPDTVVEENNGAGVVLALGAAVVGGLLGYALANKSGGHNYSSEFSEIISQNNGLNHQVHDLSLQHAHELNAIHGLHNEIARDHNQEMSGINSIRQRLNESNTAIGFKFAFRYPWDWAANRVGAYRAESWLHTLAGRAAQHGHRIRWIFNGYEPNGSVREILQVDGTTNTQKVVQVVSQFR